MTSTNDTFKAVLEDFKKRLTPKERENFQFATLKDVRESVLRIQHDQEQLRTMMNMARLESFLEAMDQFGKVIEVFVNASNFVAFVWGPMKFILQTASTYADSFEVLVHAYSQIGENMPLLEQYEGLFGSNPHMRRVLALMYADILAFHKGAMRFFQGEATLWRRIFRSIWKDFGTRFKGILDGLSRHKQLIVEQAAALHYQQSSSDSQILLQIQQYEQERSEMHLRLKEREETDMKIMVVAVLDWFSAAKSTAQDHDTFRSVRGEYPGIGDWILKDPKVQNWMQLDIPVSSILWLNGIPGAGKTILASLIIDSCLSDPSSITSYFYCKENDPEKNDCISIFRGLLSQLLNQCRDLVSYCHEKFLTTGELVLTTKSLAEQLLKLFCEKIAKQYIIIDGLDECDPAQRKLVLAFLTKMVDLCDERDPGKLRILFVSQDYSDIGKALQTATVLKLAPEDNRNDIETYVREWCTKIQKKYDLEIDKIQDIQETTCVRSQGMFLFAKLVMENLHAQETQLNLLEEIQTYGLPEGLAEASKFIQLQLFASDSMEGLPGSCIIYERIIRRMKRALGPVQWMIAHKLLGWMVCAKRPLKWREIQAAVSINPDNQSMEFDKRKLRSDIQDYCGSLVQVLPGDRVELVHTTAKIHIIQSGYVNAVAVECHLASLCLRYLTFECFESDTPPERLRSLILEGSLSFQDYAVSKWLEHVRAIVKSTPEAFVADADSQFTLREIDIALDEFADCYEDDILNCSIHEMVKFNCEPFKDYQFFDNLLPVWNHIYRYSQKNFEARNVISIKALSDAVDRNRKILENFFEVPNSSEVECLDTFYGDKIFKCPKITCFYFHEGFKDAKSRNRHINRHDRPFNCDFPDCSIAEFGFPSNKDLERHKRLFHPDIEEQGKSFTSARSVTASTKWQCDLCGKRFTRGFHHRSHLLSHSGSRPHACSECGKAFTRLNDRKRHEKIHERR